MNPSKSFFQNQLACILAGVVGAIITIRIARRYLDFMPVMVFIALAMMYLLFTIVYAFIWRRRQNQGTANNELIRAFWECLIRYFISLDMLTIGLSKIFHVQFRVPLGMLELPFNSLDEQTLLWAFFGKHYSYTVIIALLQMSAGILLMFRRTRLLGIIFLLPILFNIVLLNHYYGFGFIVRDYSLLLTLATVYLLLLEYDQLVQFFFNAKSQLPVLQFKNPWKKNAIRCSIIGIPVLLIAINKMPLFYPEYTGSYEVKKLTINNQVVPGPVSSRDSVLTKVYINKDDNDFVMDYNDYRRRFIGSYTYNEATKQLTVVWRYPVTQHDTLYAKLLPGKKPNIKLLTGRMGNETFRIEMLK